MDLTTFGPALKTCYPEAELQNLAYYKNPFFALVPKTKDSGGDTVVVSVQVSDSQNRSADATTAFAGTSDMTMKKFVLTRAKNYGMGLIDHETLRASRTKEGWLDAGKSAIESAVNGLKNDLASDLYGTGTGRRGRLASSTNLSSTVIDLTDPADARRFDVGQVLRFCDDDSGSGTLKTGTLTVTGVDEDAGKITLSAALNSITNPVSASDFVYAAGDYNSKLKGLQAWVPPTPPGATSFFGVDRTTHISKLGGRRMSGSGMPVEEALNRAAQKLDAAGGSPTHCFISYEKYADLINELGNKGVVDYFEVKSTNDINIGVQGVKVVTKSGVVEVVPDRFCPTSYAWMVDIKTWKLFGLGEIPHISDEDGKVISRGSGDNSTVRVAAYCQLGCKAPSHNVIINFG